MPLADPEKVIFKKEYFKRFHVVIAKWDSGQKEQFICVFRPTAARNPAPILAAEFANTIKTNFPRLWSALTDGTCTARTIVGDGAPVVPATVEELKKYPQFKHSEYHYDHGHGHNTIIKHTVKQGTVLNGQVESKLTVNSTLANHSNVISKLILDGRNQDVQACDDHFEENFDKPLTVGGQVHSVKKFEKLQAISKTRFTGRDRFFNSQAYLLPVLVGVYKSLIWDTDHGPTSTGMLRSACDAEFCFQFMYCVRFFRSAAVCNLRFQGRDLSKEAITEAYVDFQNDCIELKENLNVVLSQAKICAKETYSKVGQCWMTTRSTLSNLEIDDLVVNFKPYEETLNYCLDRIKEALEALRISGDAHMLRSSMYCETCFSAYTLIRSKWRQNMKNELLQLHMFGILQSTIMASLDPARIVTRFFDKADKFYKI